MKFTDYARLKRVWPRWTMKCENELRRRSRVKDREITPFVQKVIMMMASCVPAVDPTYAYDVWCAASRQTYFIQHEGEWSVGKGEATIPSSWVLTVNRGLEELYKEERKEWQGNG